MLEIIRKEKTNIDGLSQKRKREANFDWPLARFVAKNKRGTILFSKYGRMDNFLLQREISSRWLVDGVYSSKPPIYRRPRQIIVYSQGNVSNLYRRAEEKCRALGDYIQDVLRGNFSSFSAVRMWKLSIVSSLIFGMFLMTMIYRYLGQGAMAKHKEVPMAQSENQLVLGEENFKDISNGDSDGTADKITAQLLDFSRDNEKAKEDDMEKAIREMVKGHPIEKMIPYIVKKDRVVAAFIVGIAKQESDWGIHAPVDKDGNDCHNYWGYRGKNPVGTGGHTCFSSPEDAVNTVAKRLEFLVSKEKVNTPGKMVVVWKCGYDCSWDNPANVKRWISAVDMYFGKLNSED